MNSARFVIVFFMCAAVANGQRPAVTLGNDGRLVYQQTKRGERVLDFSHCGYQASERDIPNVPAKVTVKSSGYDDTQLIQAAIDSVSRLPQGRDGFRGAILLSRGQFKIAGQLTIPSSGVVLRGQGAGEGGTSITATGLSRRAVIRVEARRGERDSSSSARDRHISSVVRYVPAGSATVTLDSSQNLKAGDRVVVSHPSTKEWIKRFDTDSLGWRPRTRDIHWKRTIVSVDGTQVTMDAPLTIAIDPSCVQAKLWKADDDQLTQVGIEDLALVSEFDASNAADEEHAWFGITMNGVDNAWVRRVKFKHFAGGAVNLGDQASRITVVDCASFDPISEIGGYRRHTFFSLGQQCLFLRCWSENGLHDFCIGHCAAGPNAFVNCYAKKALGDSGPLESCASGVLYDNVRIEGNDLNLMNRWNSPSKTGYSAINCVLWQCQAANVRCESSPVGANWAIGLWATPSGNGQISQVSEFVKPVSLFQQQLRERAGGAARRIGPFLLKPTGATNPSVDQASEFTEQSTEPATQLIDLIQEHWRPGLSGREPVPLISLRKTFSAKGTAQASHRLRIKNGWLTFNDQLITGSYYTPMWWRGKLQREAAETMGPAITRFAPGRYGTGLTDELETVAERFAGDNFVGYDHHYGLWYDRRRDDHLMVRRASGEVAPPFYEQPFARSGTGRAWDGLSRYDLTNFNHWYWKRLRDFVGLGEQYGFVLFHHNYFQHNILEAGAHWADSPWRPANNVNDTGLPEPPPYVGDKRIFLAEQFYDVSNRPLRELHRNYIRQCLNNFASHRNVIQLTSGEYTGPLSFMRFWIDTIVEWEQETGNDAIVALSCTKDVQDAILADPGRSPHVDVIDIRYWTYTKTGELYAPAGGKHLSPRQHLRQQEPASTSFESIVRSIREYRLKFPGKAITYNANIHCRAKRDGWAILMGGGSMPNIRQMSSDLAEVIVSMKVDSTLTLGKNQWSLSNGRDHLLYTLGDAPTSVPFAANVKWCSIDPTTGSTGRFKQAESGLVRIEDKIVWVKRIEVKSK